MLWAFGVHKDVPEAVLQKEKQKVVRSINTISFNVENVSGVETQTGLKGCREIPSGCFCMFLGSQGELEEGERGGAKNLTWANQQSGGKTKTIIFFIIDVFFCHLHCQSFSTVAFLCWDWGRGLSCPAHPAAL